MRRCLSATLPSLLVACSGERPAAPPRTVVEDVATPAREGSGEPNLSSGEDAVFLGWLEAVGDGSHEVRVARLGPDGWREPVVVTRAADLFVNWADFPSVIIDGQGRLWAHWLQRRPAEGLSYAVRVATSADEGASWSDPWTPHEDGTPTEHGFVSLFPWDGGIGLTWLDGRGYAPGPAAEEPTREMTVRFRFAGGPGGPGPEGLLDARACDCCQTDVAVTDEGPVVVYRNRTAEEVRDIHVSRWTRGGWTEGVPVHDDGWTIAACPVNGPAVDARLRADGSALVSWLERTGGDGAELRLALVTRNHGVESVLTVTTSAAARASGFPRMTLVPWAPGSSLLAWTDVTDPERPRVRLARVEVP